jgi:hypothetical protein
MKYAVIIEQDDTSYGAYVPDLPTPVMAPMSQISPGVWPSGTVSRRSSG